MPIYVCLKCGRTVEKPVGKYYCAVCGPETMMEQVVGLKQPIKLYCTKCGYTKWITKWVDAATITDTSYRLAREHRELECPKCGAPLLSEPCILYPRGWEVLRKLANSVELKKTDVPTSRGEKLKVANCIIEVLKKKGYRAKIVGSVARETETPFSDVDILTDFPAKKYDELMSDRDIIRCLRLNPNVKVDIIPIE